MARPTASAGWRIHPRVLPSFDSVLDGRGPSFTGWDLSSVRSANVRVPLTRELLVQSRLEGARTAPFDRSRIGRNFSDSMIIGPVGDAGMFQGCSKTSQSGAVPDLSFAVTR